MATIVFDTHAFVKELAEAGMPEKQAEVLARSQATLIDEMLATKQDLKELEARLRRDMKELELRLKHDLTIRLGSMMVVAIGAVAALVKPAVTDNFPRKEHPRFTTCSASGTAADPARTAGFEPKPRPVPPFSGTPPSGTPMEPTAAMLADTRWCSTFSAGGSEASTTSTGCAPRRPGRG